MLPDGFVGDCLIEKFHDSLKDYKIQLRHKGKQMTTQEIISHIIESKGKIKN